MIYFANTSIVYLDEYMITSPYAKILLQDLADRHIQMILCVNFIMDYERIKTLENCDYMSDVIYSKKMEMIQEDCRKRKTKARKALILMAHAMGSGISSCGIQEEYGSVEEFIKQKRRYNRMLYYSLCFVNVVLIASLAWMLWVMGLPHMVAFTLTIVGILLLICSFFYGLRHDVFHLGSFLMGLLDLV